VVISFSGLISFPPLFSRFVFSSVRRLFPSREETAFNDRPRVESNEESRGVSGYFDFFTSAFLCSHEEIQTPSLRVPVFLS